MKYFGIKLGKALPVLDTYPYRHIHAFTHRGGPGSSQGQVMWDMWWTK
jgi:hypothetical protein